MKRKAVGSKQKRKPAPSKGRRKTTYEEEPSREDEKAGGAATMATCEDGGNAAQDEGTAHEPDKKKQGNVQGALEVFAKLTLQKKMEGLKAEFASLAQFTPPDVAATAFAQHKEKNRYNNIPCYDHSRVILKYLTPPETDYIHANWIADSTHIKLGGMKYICAQAPNDASLNDWWRLIWQEKPKHIIMLCRTVENGKPKCAQYWPFSCGETKNYGSVTVQNVRASTPEKETVFESSTLQVSVGAENFQLQQHRWLNWPDFGVPESGMGMLRLLRIVREAKKPTIIHCSAGVGRTGTAMAVEVALRSLLDGNPISPLDIVKDLRSQRAAMIQTENQYLYVHKTLFEYMNAKKVAKAECTEFMTAYQEIVKAHAASPPPPAAGAPAPVTTPTPPPNP